MEHIIYPLFPLTNHPGDSVKGWLGVLLCVQESSMPHIVMCGHQPEPPPSHQAWSPRRVGGISLAPCLSYFFWYKMGLRLQVVQTYRAWEAPSTSLSHRCVNSHLQYSLLGLSQWTLHSSDSVSAEAEWEPGRVREVTEEKGPPDPSRAPWMTPSASSLILEI